MTKTASKINPTHTYLKTPIIKSPFTLICPSVTLTFKGQVLTTDSTGISLLGSPGPPHWYHCETAARFASLPTLVPTHQHHWDIHTNTTRGSPTGRSHWDPLLGSPGSQASLGPSHQYYCEPPLPGSPGLPTLAALRSWKFLNPPQHCPSSTSHTSSCKPPPSPALRPAPPGPTSASPKHNHAPRGGSPQGSGGLTLALERKRHGVMGRGWHPECQQRG